VPGLGKKRGLRASFFVEVMNVLVFPILFLLFFLPLFAIFLAMSAAAEPAPQRVRRPCD
jgi:hypothetical protein